MFCRLKYTPVILVVVALAVGAYYGYRSFVREHERSACQKNLKALGLAMHDYHAKHGHLPPAYVLGPDGKPWHSWRVLILPFVGRQDLYDVYHFDEPWNGPNNSKLIDQMPAVFGCPADRGRRPGTTSYVAIVGSETVWPHERSMKFTEIGDGTSNTILLMETVDSDIPWTEPRDLTVAELFPDDEAEDVSRRFSSKHPGIVNLVLADGSVRPVRSYELLEDEGPQVLYAMVTANGGQFSEWPKGREQSIKAASFPPEVAATELSGSVVVAHLHDPIASRQNVIWCATAQIGWDELRQKIGAAPQVADCELADGLAKTPFPRAALSSDSYVATMGTLREGVKERIDQEMGRKFPGITPPALSATDPDLDVVLFAFLQKNLPFEKRFKSLKEPLKFHAPGGDIDVKSFGLKKAKGGAEIPADVKKQVLVLDYRSDDDFVIRLTPKSDEIVLAKVQPAATLSETVDQVQKRIAAASEPRPGLADEETLIVPKLAFNILRRYDELIGKQVANFTRRGVPHVVTEAKQSIRFLLNEKGARVESYFEGVLWGNGHSPPPPQPKIRHFVFDKPFLLFLKESNAETPYLVLWVANGEIMQKFEGK